MCENTEVKSEDTLKDPNIYIPFAVMIDLPDRGYPNRWSFFPGSEVDVSSIAPDIRGLAATQLRYVADLLAPEKVE